MEYILADVLEANGAYVIPDFVPGSVAVTSTGNPLPPSVLMNFALAIVIVIECY